MDKIKFIMSQMWFFLLPFIKILLGQAGTALAKAAMSAVQAAAKGQMADEERRRLAFKTITVDLQRQGIEMATSAINAAIEAAVLKMKEK